MRRRSSRSLTKPAHQNEIASLPHPVGRNTFFLLVMRWNTPTRKDPPARVRTNPGARPVRMALSLTVPPTLLASADVVIEREGYYRC